MLHAEWVCSRQHAQITLVTRKFCLAAGVQGAWLAMASLTSALCWLPESVPAEETVAMTVLGEVSTGWHPC